MTIPADSIVWRDEDGATREDTLPGVFINNDGRASWRQIELGLRSSTSVEVLKGVTPDDSVIVPLERKSVLTEGVRVTSP